jgi:extradiol dioxygenase family protein
MSPCLAGGRVKSHNLSSERLKGFTIDAMPASGSPCHLAIPVHCMKEARNFYGNVLGLKEGRRDESKWQDYSLSGHQLVCHYVGENYRCQDHYNPVDGDEVPVPHFGVVLKEDEFHELAARLKKNGVKFIIEPHKRFQGQAGEQWTMFFKDPSSNNLEFKAMTNPTWLFAKYNIKDVK